MIPRRHYHRPRPVFPLQTILRERPSMEPTFLNTNTIIDELTYRLKDQCVAKWSCFARRRTKTNTRNARRPARRRSKSKTVRLSSLMTNTAGRRGRGRIFSGSTHGSLTLTLEPDEYLCRETGARAMIHAGSAPSIAAILWGAPGSGAGRSPGCLLSSRRSIISNFRLHMYANTNETGQSGREKSAASQAGEKKQ